MDMVNLNQRKEITMDLSKAEMMAKDLIKHHNIGYTFGWINTRRVLGRCYYYRKHIALSRKTTPYQTEDQVLDTILHEIAHALAFKAGGRHHDNIWKGFSNQLGAIPTRIQPGEHKPMLSTYIGKCLTCGHEWNVNKRIRNAQHRGCKTNTTSFGVILWTRRDNSYLTSSMKRKDQQRSGRDLLLKLQRETISK